MTSANTKSKMKYEIKYNTGDYMWDNYPRVEYCSSLEELIDELDLTDEEVKELEKEGYLEHEADWRVYEL